MKFEVSLGEDQKSPSLYRHRHLKSLPYYDIKGENMFWNWVQIVQEGKHIKISVKC